MPPKAPESSFLPSTKFFLVLGVIGAIMLGTFAWSARGGSIFNIALKSEDPINQGLIGYWSYDGGATTASTTPASNGYSYSRSITIDQSKVTGSGDFTDFPVLVAETLTDLRTVGNGGDVTDANGYDIIFTSDSAGSVQLDHEIEKYTASTGEFVAWVRVPTLDFDTNTVIYMWYGNSSVTTTQEDEAGVWDANYVAVHHLAETSGQHLDSTSNNNDSTSVSVATQGTAIGKIGGADDFNGTSNSVSIPDATSLDITNTGTIEAWMRTDNTNGSEFNFSSSWVARNAPNGAGADDQSGHDSVIIGENILYGILLCTNTTEDFGVASSTLNGATFNNWDLTKFTTVPAGCGASEGGSLGMDTDGVHVYYAAMGVDTTTSTFSTATATPTYSQVSAWTASGNPTGAGASEGGGVDMIIVGNTAYYAAINVNGTTETLATTSRTLGTNTTVTWQTDAATNYGAAANENCSVRLASDGYSMIRAVLCNSAGTELYTTASTTIGVVGAPTNVSQTAPNGAGTADFNDFSLEAMGGRLYHAAALHNDATEAYSTASSSIPTGGTLSWTARATADGSSANDQITMSVVSDGKNMFYSVFVASSTVEAFFTASSSLPARPFISKRNAYEAIQVGTGFAFDWAGRPYTFGTSTDTTGFDHIVITQDGTTLNMYENGVLRRTQTTSVDFESNANALLIGAGHRSDGTQIYFDGVIDEVRISNTARSADWITTSYNNMNATSTFYTVGSESSNPIEPGNAYTIIDQSGNGNNASTTDNKVVDLTPGRIGQAVLLNGTNDYLTAGDVAAVDSVTDLSGCSWVNHSATSDDDPILTKTESGGSQGFIFFRDEVSSVSSRTDIYSIFIADSADTDSARLETASSVALDTDTWNHVCFTADLGSATGLRLYVNGTEVPDSPVSLASISAIDAGTAILGIGVHSETLTQTFAGILDDTRLYNRILSREEIIRLYQLGGTTKINTTINTQPELENGLVGHWTMDGKDINLSANTVTAEIRDRSSSANHGDWRNHASTTVPGRIGQAVNFDGSNDAVSLSTVAAQDLDSNYTLSAWVFLEPGGSVAKANIIRRGANASSNNDPSQQYRLQVDQSSSNTLRFVTSDGTTANVASYGTLDNERWHHIVCTHDGSNKTCYIDGTLSGSPVADTVGNYVGTEDAMIIGCASATCTGGQWDGSIDDVRIYNRVLSQAEISRLYQLGGTAKLNTTITTQPALENGLVGHWTLDGKDINLSDSTVLAEVRDRSGSGIHLNWLFHASTTVPGRIGQGVYFDGTGIMQYGTSDGDPLDLDSAFTISLWLNRSDSVGGAAQTIIRRGANNGNDQNNQYEIKIAQVSGSMDVTFGDGTSSQVVTIGTITEIGNWVHLACVKGSAQLTCYKNGAVLSGPTAITIGAYAGTEATFLIGSVINSGNTKYGGDMDDIRIYNRALSRGEILELYNLGR